MDTDIRGDGMIDVGAPHTAGPNLELRILCQDKPRSTDKSERASRHAGW